MTKSKTIGLAIFVLAIAITGAWGQLVQGSWFSDQDCILDGSAWTVSGWAPAFGAFPGNCEAGAQGAGQLGQVLPGVGPFWEGPVWVRVKLWYNGPGLDLGVLDGEVKHIGNTGGGWYQVQLYLEAKPRPSYQLVLDGAGQVTGVQAWLSPFPPAGGGH